MRSSTVAPHTVVHVGLMMVNSKDCKRKKSKGGNGNGVLVPSKQRRRNGRSPTPEKQRDGARIWGGAAYLCTGLFLACYLGFLFARHTNQLHENELWFSHITELEREISFRTESGLYYSYYKQIVGASSLREGLLSLCHDNKTESGREINIIQRFNIFPEISIATLYRILPLKNILEPIYFYIDSVLLLNIAYVVAMFCTSWLLSGSLMAGGLSFTLFFFNREDATRLEIAFPLRESFAFPFIAVQILFTSLCLHKAVFDKLGRSLQMVCVFMVLVSSVCVALSWQFAQFVFLFESAVLSITYMAGLMSHGKMLALVWCYGGALVVTSALQSFNTSLLASLCLGLNIATTIVTTALEKIHITSKTSKVVVAMAIQVILMVAVSAVVRVICGVSADSHIFKFLLAKFGIISPMDIRDFDSLLYLCEPAFQHLTFHTLMRLTSTLLLPAYLVTMATVVLLAGSYTLRTPSNDCHEDRQSNSTKTNTGDLSVSAPVLPSCLSPALVFNVGLSCLFCLVAVTAQRFKYLWVPHTCVVVGAGLVHSDVWRAVAGRIGLHGNRVKMVQMLVVGAIMALITIKELPGVWEQLAVLREFYDPNTVQLMKWITSSTPQHAAFAGSMQLLAGVRLCTGRTITNHPHFEDKELRDRTKLVYQMYGKVSPKDVHSILSSFGAEYIILEEGLCYFRPSSHCSITDIVDIVNGHPLQTHSDSTLSGVHTKLLRFCDGIRTGGPEYVKYFSLVFWNRTFRVYKLLGFDAESAM